MQLFRMVMATVITVVWLIGYALAFFTGTPQPDGLNVLEALVLGWVFGGSTFDAVKRVLLERNERPDDDRK